MNQVKIYVVSSTAKFRKLARLLPVKSDIVIEIGCSFGKTSELLAQKSDKVLCVDHTQLMLDRARDRCGNLATLSFHWADARNLTVLKSIAPHVDIVFVDIGGDARADKMILLLQMYLTIWKPKAVVGRNISLARLASLFAEVEVSQSNRHKDLVLPAHSANIMNPLSSWEECR